MKVLEKKTHLTLKIAGSRREYRIYEKPLWYNWAPQNINVGTRTRAKARRGDNLGRCREKINDLVEANRCAITPRFLTLTFAENITSLREAHAHWQIFIRRLRKMLGNVKYLCVIEFQKRGAVHYHVLFFDMRAKRGLKKSIEEMWGKGFVKFKNVRALEKIEYLGLYLAKYLQKDVMDARLIGEKAFFGSKNLTKVERYRDENFCAEMLLREDLSCAKMEVYTSAHFGVIKKITLKENYEARDTIKC